MSRTMRGWLGAASMSAAALFVAHGAAAQDLAPPSTGPAGSATPAAGAPGAGASQPQAARLDADEKKDSGRGLEWVYVNGGAGYSFINMASFSASNLGIQNTSSQGPSFDVGAGIRLFILTLGGRATMNELSAFNLWQLDGELAFRIPIGNWDPYFGLHGGYCFVGALTDGISGAPSIQVTGGDLGAQLGVDYYFNHFISLGLNVSGSALFLHRPPTTLPAAVVAQLTPQQQAAYQQTGDSVGGGVAPSIRLGLHL